MNVIANGMDCFSPLTSALCQVAKNSGYKGVGRYLGKKTHGLSNGMTPDEVKLIHSFGLDIWPIWEIDTKDTYGGHSQGVLYAAQAMDEMQWLGLSEGVTVYFANDIDSPPSAYDLINQYMDGVRKSFAGHYIDGIYAGYDVLANVKASKKWQAAGWSNGKLYPSANMRQVQTNVDFHGIKIDTNEVYSNPGWWPVVADNTKTPKDTQGTQWEEVTTWAVENGVMFTYGDGTFKPDEPITRGQAAASFMNLYKLIKKG